MTCCCLHSCYLLINQSKISTNHHPGIPVLLKIQGQTEVGKIPQKIPKIVGTYSRVLTGPYRVGDMTLHSKEASCCIHLPSAANRGCKLMVDPRFLWSSLGKCIYWGNSRNLVSGEYSGGYFFKRVLFPNKVFLP